jgi:hypothetical protein
VVQAPVALGGLEATRSADELCSFSNRTCHRAIAAEDPAELAGVGLQTRDLAIHDRDDRDDLGRQNAPGRDRRGELGIERRRIFEADVVRLREVLVEADRAG